MDTRLKTALLLSLICLILFGGGFYIYRLWIKGPKQQIQKENKIKSEKLRKLKKKAQKYPENVGIQNSIAGFYRRKGELQKSLAAAEKTLSMDAENYLAHFIKEGVYLEQGKTSKALEEAKKVLELTPENNSYHRRARDVIVRKLTEEALDMAEKGKIDKALNKLNETLEIAPQNHEIHFWRGLIYTQEMKNAKARSELKKFIELAPDDSEKLKRAQKLLDRISS